ncbi:zinc finger protein 184-like [Achroia grisella]|uniref:zinc finger protein 184-like n=1 Tax=Achroia grisella TaxID=688607 RepID=UPI0027D27CD5|nr:zinc finger protein 184-like [Achroia grisella]
MYVLKQNNLSQLLACRGCLATDVKLYDLFENKLWEQFARFVGVPVLAGDGYPHHLCSICAVYLQKFIAYRSIYRKAQNMLEEAELRGIRITTSYIRKMDRKKHIFLNYIKKELFNIDLLNPDGDIVEAVHSHENSDEAIDTNEDYKANCTVTKQEYIYDKSLSGNGTEFVPVGNKLVTETDCIKEFLENFTETNDIFETNNEIDSNNTTVDLTSEDLKENPEIPAKRKRLTKKVVPITEGNVKRKKAKKRDVADITKEFADQHNFNLTVYTREQQIEQIKMLKEMPTSKFRCDYCGIGFKNKNKLLNHYRSKHDALLGDYVCSICHTRFREKDYLYSHNVAVHRFKFVCKICGFNTRARLTAKAHSEFHAGKTFTCECGKSFVHETTYLSHRRLTHTAKLISCDYCGESFIGERGLRTHKRKIHSDVLEESMVKCGKCNSNFRTEDALTKHHSLSCGSYNCVNCGDGFATENLLKYHLLQNHNHRTSSEKLSECNTCKVKFHNPAALFRHSVDRCGDVVPCVQCGIGFATELDMNEHLNVHSTEEYKCEVCQKTFKFAHNFAEHYARHAPKNAAQRGLRKKRRPKNTKRVMCEVCGQLILECGYPMHLKIHSGEREYKCTLCPKRFRVPLSLQFHMRVHTNERPYECDYCQKKFKLRAAIVRHIMAVHFGVKPHQCHLCQKSFTTSTCVKMHIKTVHMKIPLPPRIRKRTPKSTE